MICVPESHASTGTDRCYSPAFDRSFSAGITARAKIVPFRPLSKEVMRGVVALKATKWLTASKNSWYYIQLFSIVNRSDRQNCTAVEQVRNADAVIDQSLLPEFMQLSILRRGQSTLIFISAQHLMVISRLSFQKMAI